MVFGLIDKLLTSGKIPDSGMNIVAWPNIIMLKNLRRAGI